MKKQIFNLIVSATILTTNPLFAMESNLEESLATIAVSQKKEQEDQKNSDIPSHKCASCKPELLLKNINRLKGKGSFFIENLDEPLILLGFFTIDDMLACSCTSKAMYNYFQHPLIWGNIATRDYLPLKTQLCIKEQVKEDEISNLKLFKEWGRHIDYVVRNSLLKKFVNNPCKTTWNPFPYEKNGRSYHFSIGKREFELYTSNKYSTLEKKMNEPEGLSVFSGEYFSRYCKQENLCKGFYSGMAADICIIELKPKEN